MDYFYFNLFFYLLNVIKYALFSLYLKKYSFGPKLWNLHIKKMFFCRFEKLFYVLAKTKENEQRMIDRCSDLTKEVCRKNNGKKLEKN